MAIIMPHEIRESSFLGGVIEQILKKHASTRLELHEAAIKVASYCR